MQWWDEALVIGLGSTTVDLRTKLLFAIWTYMTLIDKVHEDSSSFMMS